MSGEIDVATIDAFKEEGARNNRGVDSIVEVSKSVLFSDVRVFYRQVSVNHHNLLVWAMQSLRVIFPREYQQGFSANLWAGIL